MAALTHGTVANGRDDRGILAPARAGSPHFTLVRHPPAEDLEEIVDRFWVVQWDLTGEPAPRRRFRFRASTSSSALIARAFTAPPRRGLSLASKARVGCSARSSGPLDSAACSSAARRRRTSSIARWGSPRCSVATARRSSAPILASGDHRAAIALVERFVRARHSGVDVDDRDANRIVELARVDPSLTRVAEPRGAIRHARTCARTLASRARRASRRSALLRRFRVQEAAARLAAGDAVDLASLALDLGYFDQPHFIRDFKSQVGRTPAQYANLCAS